MEQENSSFWNKLGLFVCRVLNLTPICHVSQDSSFDTVDSLVGLRFSVLSIPWGDKHLYILTFSEHFCCKLFWVLKIADLQPPRSYAELQRLEDEFLKLDDGSSSIKSQLRIEFLKHKNSECQNSINTLNNKVNSYIAIALVYAGFYAFLFQSTINVFISPLGIVMWLILVLSGMSLINVLILLRKYLQVKGAVKSKFSSFKESPNWMLLAKNIYIDWLTAQEEQLAAASLVKNIEKYFIRSILLSSILFFTMVLNLNVEPSLSLNENQKSTSEFILLNEMGVFSPKELLRLSDALSSDKFITFIYSSSNIAGKNTTDFTTTALGLSEQNQIIKLSDNLINNNMLIATIEDKK